MRLALVIGLALLTAACAKSPGAAPAAAPAPVAKPVAVPLPPQPDMAGALFALAECDPGEDADCAASPTAVRIDAARCVPIAPEDGNPSAACRLDWTEIMPPPHKDVAHANECVRFILLGIDDKPGAFLWAVRYTPPGHTCEVPAR